MNVCGWHIEPIFWLLGALAIMAAGTYKTATRRPRAKRSTFTKAEKERIMKSIADIVVAVTAATKTLDDSATTLQSVASDAKTALAGTGVDTSSLDQPLADLANAISNIQGGVSAVRDAVPAAAPPAPAS